MTAYERVVEALKDVEMTPVQRHWLEEDLKEAVSTKRVTELTRHIGDLEDDIRHLTWKLDNVRDAVGL